MPAVASYNRWRAGVVLTRYGNTSFRRRTERRGLRLWPVGTVLVLTFTAAVLVAAAVFYTGWDLLGVRGPERRIDSKTLFDLVKLAFGVVAGAVALVTLVVAYRRQRVDEDGALRESTWLRTERFTTAVAQLGEASPAVRLGGIHAPVQPGRDTRPGCTGCGTSGPPAGQRGDGPNDSRRRWKGPGSSRPSDPSSVLWRIKR